MEKCPLQLVTQWTLRPELMEGRVMALSPFCHPPLFSFLPGHVETAEAPSEGHTSLPRRARCLSSGTQLPLAGLQESGSRGRVVGSPSEPLSPLEEMLSHAIWWPLMARSSSHKNPAARLGSSHLPFLENQMTVPEFLRKWDDLQ